MTSHETEAGWPPGQAWCAGPDGEPPRVVVIDEAPVVLGPVTDLIIGRGSDGKAPLSDRILRMMAEGRIGSVLLFDPKQASAVTSQGNSGDLAIFADETAAPGQQEGKP